MFPDTSDHFVSSTITWARFPIARKARSRADIGVACFGSSSRRTLPSHFAFILAELRSKIALRNLRLPHREIERGLHSVKGGQRDGKRSVLGRRRGRYIFAAFDTSGDGFLQTVDRFRQTFAH